MFHAELMSTLDTVHEYICITQWQVLWRKIRRRGPSLLLDPWSNNYPWFSYGWLASTVLPTSQFWTVKAVVKIFFHSFLRESIRVRCQWFRAPRVNVLCQNRCILFIPWQDKVIILWQDDLTVLGSCPTSEPYPDNRNDNVDVVLLRNWNFNTCIDELVLHTIVKMVQSDCGTKFWTQPDAILGRWPLRYDTRSPILGRFNYRSLTLRPLY